MDPELLLLMLLLTFDFTVPPSYIDSRDGFYVITFQHNQILVNDSRTSYMFFVHCA